MSNKEITADLLENGIRSGDRFVLSRAITLAESKRPEDQDLAAELFRRLNTTTASSFRVGITGVPGAGKSTFLDLLGMTLISRGYKVAVLSIDPSSTLSKGSILGDKTRMERLSRDPSAYIRPTASGSVLGGVSGHTREAIALCEAAGYHYIFVETVGVGQSEVAVHQMTDFFVLLLLTGSGDDLQGMKRGIMELTDLIVVNKSDGENIERAENYAKELVQMIHFLPNHPFGWPVPVLTTSSLTGDGIHQVLNKIAEFEAKYQTNGLIRAKRNQQNVQWLNQKIEQQLMKSFFEIPGMIEFKAQIEKKVMAGQLTVDHAIRQIFSKQLNLES